MPMPPCCPARPDDDGDVPVMSGDLLIRGARVIDGTGAPWFLGDVRIRGGRIAAIGASLSADDAVLVDADGRYLAPGFIDAHCYDDLICLREPERVEKATQGVTTLVVGNCSFSLYPATPSSTELLRRTSQDCWARRRWRRSSTASWLIATRCMGVA